MTAKTKLTTAMRKEFVQAVIEDIKCDLDEESIRKLVTKDILSQVPGEVRALWNDPTTKNWAASQFFYPNVYVNNPNYDKDRKTRAYSSRQVRAPDVLVPFPKCGGSPSLSIETEKAIQKIMDAWHDKVVARNAMEECLKGMANTCKTLEALREMFPDLTKYMPEPPAPDVAVNVPAVQVKDFLRDLRKLGVPPKENKEAA